MQCHAGNSSSSTWPKQHTRCCRDHAVTLFCINDATVTIFITMWLLGSSQCQGPAIECMCKGKGKKYSSLQLTSSPRELMCHKESHSVTCLPAEVTFAPLPQPIKAGTRFSNPVAMQGWVQLVGLVTYRGSIPTWRWSPIPVLTELNVE